MYNTIPVFLKVHDRKLDESEAVAELEIGDSIMSMRGPANLIHDLTRGMCEFFCMDVNPDVTIDYDFVGMIPKEQDASPSAEVRLERVLGKRGMDTSVVLRIGNKAMKCSSNVWEEAQGIAGGFVSLLGLSPADRKGKRFTGRVLAH